MARNSRRKSRLAAVLVTDTVGYTKRMDANEPATIAAVRACTIKQTQVVKRHRGKFIKGTGDGTMSAYASAVDALEAALEIQRAMTTMNRGKRRDRHIVLRAGLAVGDVYSTDDGDIHSRCVIMATRLEAIAPPGTVCCPVSVRDDLAGKVSARFTEIGRRSLKGFSEPVHVFLVDPKVRLTKSAAAKDAETLFNNERAYLTGGGDVDRQGAQRVFRVEVANHGTIPAFLYAFDVQFATLKEVQDGLLAVKERHAFNARIPPDGSTKEISRISITRPDATVIYGAFWYRDVGGTPERVSRFILRIADDDHTRLDVTGVSPEYTRWT